MTIRIGRTLPPAAAPIPLKDVLRVLPSCFRQSVKEPRLVKEIKQGFGQRYCLLVSSGKAALVLILRALRNLYPDRNEVVIPAFTCYSVPAAIKVAGLKIRLCDTGKSSLDFDKEQLGKIIEADNRDNRILCVLVTHLFGCPADFHGIKEIVGDEIPIVEDAAQAMSEKLGNKKIGTLGDVGFYSMGRGKALSTIEGGVIVTNKDDLGAELNRVSEKLETFTSIDRIELFIKAIFTTLLQHPLLFWLPKSLPFLRLGETIYEEKFPICIMSSVQINLTHNWRERLQGHQRARRKNINFWQKEISQNLSFLCSKTQLTNLVRLPVLAPSVEDRDWFCLKSDEWGCGVMPSYPTAINQISQISGEFEGQLYPNANFLAECLMTLPVHEYVKESDRTKILNILNSRNE